MAVRSHGSATPDATLRKLGVDVVVHGECEEVVAALVNATKEFDIAGTAVLHSDEAALTGAPQAAPFTDLPALRWPDGWIARHAHYHHRFDRSPTGPEAEVSRECPHDCLFYAKIDYRDAYRRMFGLPVGTMPERVYSHYLAGVSRFSDIQDEAPLPLPELGGVHMEKVALV